MTISLNQQIEEVERELEQREKVYPRLYAKGTLQRAHGDYQVQRMQAVRDTLLWLQRNEVEIRQIMAEKFAESERKRLGIDGSG